MTDLSDTTYTKLLSSSCQWKQATTLVIIFWKFTVSQYKVDLLQVKRVLISGRTTLDLES